MVEGVDGTGKSSISKELARRLGARYYRCPPKLILPIRRLADSSPYLFRYLYYLVGNYIAQYEIKSLLKNTSVVCDWYVFSTIAYHSVLLRMRLRFPDILMPDKLIYLTATKEQIKNRLDARSTTNKFENLAFLEEVRRVYAELVINFPSRLEVDTTNKTVEGSISEILQAIRH